MLLVEVRVVDDDVVEVLLGVDDVLGATEDVVPWTTCVTFWTIDCTGVVVEVVFGVDAGAVVGVVVGTEDDGVLEGTEAAPTGVMPAIEPAASTSPDVITPTAVRR